MERTSILTILWVQFSTHLNLTIMFSPIDSGMLPTQNPSNKLIPYPIWINDFNLVLTPIGAGTNVSPKRAVSMFNDGSSTRIALRCTEDSVNSFSDILPETKELVHYTPAHGDFAALWVDGKNFVWLSQQVNLTKLSTSINKTEITKLKRALQQCNVNVYLRPDSNGEIRFRAYLVAPVKVEIEIL